MLASLCWRGVNNVDRSRLATRLATHNRPAAPILCQPSQSVSVVSNHGLQPPMRKDGSSPIARIIRHFPLSEKFPSSIAILCRYIQDILLPINPYQKRVAMTTISSIASSVLQNAMTQVSDSPTSAATPTQSAGSSSTPATSTASDNTSVTLGSTASTPLTYNSLGKITSAQITQLEQAINNDITNTIDNLFSGTSQSSSNSSSSIFSSLVGLPGSSSTSTTSTSSSSTSLANQAAQDVLNANSVVNDTLASLFSGSSNSSFSGSSNSSNSDNSSLSSLLSLTAPTASSSSTSSTQITQSAITAAQNAVTKTLSSL